jgi:hypothetical protein
LPGRNSGGLIARHCLDAQNTYVSRRLAHRFTSESIGPAEIAVFKPAVGNKAAATNGEIGTGFLTGLCAARDIHSHGLVVHVGLDRGKAIQTIDVPDYEVILFWCFGPGKFWREWGYAAIPHKGYDAYFPGATGRTEIIGKNTS